MPKQQQKPALITVCILSLAVIFSVCLEFREYHFKKSTVIIMSITAFTLALFAAVIAGKRLMIPVFCAQVIVGVLMLLFLKRRNR